MDQLVQFVDWKVMLVQVVNFAIIFYVLSKFVFKPLIAFLDEESAKRQALEENARAAEHIVIDAQNEATAIVDTAKKEARAIMSDSEELAKKEYALTLANARKEAEQIKTKASKDIENERQALHSELRERVLSIALRANEKLFGKKEANAEFIAQMVKEEN